MLLFIRLETQFYGHDMNADTYLFTMIFWLLLVGSLYGWSFLIRYVFENRRWLLLLPAVVLTYYAFALSYWLMLKVSYLYFDHKAPFRAAAAGILSQGDVWTQIHSGRVATFNLTLIGVFLLPAFLLKLARHLFVAQRRYLQLEQEKLQVELDFLKNQINPHFFFNTLNNLFALTLQQSEKAPDMILRLSDMMRYSLYETNENRVPLSKEIRFIEDYIGLEKLRHDDKVEVTFEVEGDPGDQKMAPLILVTFIENAFKHGARSTMHSAWIHIRMRLEGETLIFSVANNKPVRRNPAGNLMRQTTGGIGIANTRKRLHLLYPDKHQLDITDDPDQYLVQLTVLLS